MIHRCIVASSKYPQRNREEKALSCVMHSWPCIHTTSLKEMRMQKGIIGQSTKLTQDKS